MPVELQPEECALQWETFVYECYWSLEHKFPVTCLYVYDYDPKYTASMISIKNSHPVNKQSIGKRNMGMNLLASTKRPTSHQRNSLITIPSESCLNSEGYYSAEGTPCYEEWMWFETIECNFTNWSEECEAVYDLIVNPLDYDDDDYNQALLAATG